MNGYPNYDHYYESQAAQDANYAEYMQKENSSKMKLSKNQESLLQTIQAKGLVNYYKLNGCFFWAKGFSPNIPTSTCKALINKGALEVEQYFFNVISYRISEAGTDYLNGLKEAK